MGSAASVMSTFQKHRNIFLDVGCVAFVGLVVLFLSFCVPAFRRGFFCDDSSIRYPLVDPVTISTFQLVVVSFLAPLSAFAVVDGLRLFDLTTPRDSWHTVTSGLLRSLYEVFGVFVFGAGLNQVTVDVAKYTVGRLRPHFMDACRPLDNVCSLVGPGQYVTDYQCSGDPSTVEEARLSFPSGHAALSFYAAVYVSVFLQQRLYWRGARLARHLAQGSCLMVAWFTALSRVQDYMHHPTDVLAGVAVGTVWALIMTRYVIDMRLDDQHVTKEELRSLRSTPVHMQGANNV